MNLKALELCQLQTIDLKDPQKVARYVFYGSANVEFAHPDGRPALVVSIPVGATRAVIWDGPVRLVLP
jgi:hypothetical protein